MPGVQMHSMCIGKDQYTDSAYSSMYTHLRSMSRNHIVLLHYCAQWFAFSIFKMREEQRIRDTEANVSFVCFPKLLPSQTGIKKEVGLLQSHPNVTFCHKTRIFLRNFSCIQWFGAMAIYSISV